MNQTELLRALGLPTSTLKRYFTLFEAVTRLSILGHTVAKDLVLENPDGVIASMLAALSREVIRRGSDG
ncbi:MAG: hypothetical protein AMXMBFR33_10000 [Candidatus Xenobia bacterium]